MKESLEKPAKLEAYRTKLQLNECKKQVIEDAATKMLAANVPIVRVQQVQAAVKEAATIDVSYPEVREVLKKEMRLGFRKASVVPIQSNLPRCLVLRQQFALRMIPLLEAGCFAQRPTRRIINVDESWLNNTRFIRKSWVPSDAAGTYTDKQVQPRISLLVALDTDGRLWCALTQANTNADVMTLFLRHLAQELDRDEPGWQETSTILLDNAA